MFVITAKEIIIAACVVVLIGIVLFFSIIDWVAKQGEKLMKKTWGERRK